MAAFKKEKRGKNRSSCLSPGGGGRCIAQLREVEGDKEKGLF